MRRSHHASLAALASSIALAFAIAPVSAQTPPAAKPAAVAKAPKKGAPSAIAEPAVADATPDQVKAADLVFYGKHDCELGQSIEVVQNPKHSAYVDVRSGKTSWLMKPVLSSTGAVRLEDVKGQTLLVQIATKSMLLDVKAGRRLNDECVCDKHRELIAEAKAAKAAAEAAPVKAREEAALAAEPRPLLMAPPSSPR